ncbi:DUF3347 domain-containing protein [Pelagicoccus sp. SDUM812003]|uniref:DUF3347 domain-containing protein n=1 Tax=Pelagicoccus sp. SDUM812003 TaxID=3041267 RepID=UPI0028108E6F|nr:DUF3347 domain-containing protein [Pelagicoccus sp. SDUM812003]MDQ8202058.1 DUF3347 domain-containing protein [Pelagicoccus sp. SDUM812003]
MKALIISLIASFAAVSTLHAHCGTCGVGDEKHADSEDKHAKCYQGTMDGYFSIQKALAGDDLAAAKNAASTLLSDMENSECSMDGGDCCAEYNAAAEKITKASDIKAARSAFKSFSDALIAQVESHGSENAAYLMHCPMAFNNKGASWLQDNADLKNPYYGSMMLACGVQKASFGEQGKKKGHSGHQH